MNDQTLQDIIGVLVLLCGASALVGQVLFPKLGCKHRGDKVE